MNNTVFNLIAVGGGGALGAITRYALSLLLAPYSLVATMAANIIGSFLIGIAITSTNGRILLFLSVGFCGGFTTFSTFSQQTLGLINQGNYLTALAYSIGSMLLCVMSTWAGISVANIMR